MPILLGLRALPWRLIGFAGLALAFVSLGVALKMERAHSAKLKAQLTACAEARQADHDRYRAAQAEASAQNKLQVQRIEQDYAANNERAKNAYQADLVRVRAEFERRMRQAASPAPGSAGHSGTPQAPAPASGIDGSARVPVPAEDLLYGAEIELRLLHLQRLIREQMKVQR